MLEETGDWSNFTRTPSFDRNHNSHHFPDRAEVLPGPGRSVCTRVSLLDRLSYIGILTDVLNTKTGLLGRTLYRDGELQKLFARAREISSHKSI